MSVRIIVDSSTDVGEQYRQGYANRAERTYDYLADHDIDWSVLDV